MWRWKTKTLPLLALLFLESTKRHVSADNAAGSLSSLPALLENLNNRGWVGHIVNAQKYQLITKTHLLITKTHLKEWTLSRHWAWNHIWHKCFWLGSCLRWSMLKLYQPMRHKASANYTKGENFCKNIPKECIILLHQRSSQQTINPMSNHTKTSPLFDKVAERNHFITTALGRFEYSAAQQFFPQSSTDNSIFRQPEILNIWVQLKQGSKKPEIGYKIRKKISLLKTQIF